MNPKMDCELLLDELLPFVEKLLADYGEFFPVGGYMYKDGTIAHASASDGTEHPPSQELIDMLHKGFKQMSERGEVRATALLYDVRIAPPDTGVKQDAILAELDHEADYSVEVVFPYKLKNGELNFGNTFAHTGNSAIFESGG